MLDIPLFADYMATCHEDKLLALANVVSAMHGDCTRLTEIKPSRHAVESSVYLQILQFPPELARSLLSVMELELAQPRAAIDLWQTQHSTILYLNGTYIVYNVQNDTVYLKDIMKVLGIDKEKELHLVMADFNITVAPERERAATSFLKNGVRLRAL